MSAAWLLSNRLPRTLACLALLATLYGLYAAAASPWIEPRTPHRASHGAAAGAPAPRSVDRLPELGRLFPAGAWELDKPKVLETDYGLLLLKDYRTLPDGRLEIKPCTLVAYPESAASGDTARGGRALVMQAPAGATLTFDEPLDLRRTTIGRLVGGRLEGEIRIFSPAEPGGDALEIVTRHVQIDQRRIWTPHEVRFQYGASRGSGSDLTITLLASGATSAGGRPQVSGVESLELVHVDEIVMELPAEGALLGPEAAGAAPAAARPADQLSITCRGPLLVDLLRRAAVCEDDVQVRLRHGDGAVDTLRCHWLGAMFSAGDLPLPGVDPLVGEPLGPAADPTAHHAPLTAGKLLVTRLTAVGQPVSLDAPFYQAAVEAQRIDYDLLGRRLVLDGERGVSLRQGDLWCVARQVQYELPIEGPLGRLWAQGPGRLQGVTRQDAAAEPFSAAWSNELRIRPQEGLQVVSLVGDASLDYPPVGSFTAGEVHLWLRPQAPPSGPAAGGATSSSPSLAFAPDRLLAAGAVRVATTMLRGATERLEAWFVDAPPDALPPDALAPDATPPDTDLAAGLNEGLAERAHAAGPPLELAGQLVRVRLLRRGPQTTVDEVAIEGGVRLWQADVAPQAPPALALEGDLLQMLGATGPDAQVKVVGQPARVAVKGLALVGAAVQLARAQNRLWIDSPGEMTLPIPRGSLAGMSGMSGAPAAPPPAAADNDPPQWLRVAWRDRMAFDGAAATFTGGVTASLEPTVLRAQTLTARLTTPLDFGQPRGAAVELADLRFAGGVEIEHAGRDEAGQLASQARIALRELTLEQASGRVLGVGPGWLESVGVSTGGANPLAGRRAAEPAPTGSDAGAPRLAYAYVAFEQGLSGNWRQQWLELGEPVRAVYGPVARWEERLDPAQPATLDAGAMLLSCQRLQAAARRQGGALSSWEFTALGRTLVETRTMSARGERLSFDQGKQLLVLEGDGRRDAEISGQTRVGGPVSNAAARQIFISLADGGFWVNDARYLDLQQLDALGRGAAGP